jgi:hypothetical protein
MKLLEMFEMSPPGLQDVSADNSQPKWGDSRKTKLTLRQINKLRRMQEVREYERAENLKQVRKQYAPPAQPGV